MKPKINIIVKFFFPVAAGIETNIMETYSVLADKGWDIELQTTKDTLTERNVLIPEETIRGVHIHRWPWIKWLGFFPKMEVPPNSIVALHNFNITPHAFFMTKAIFQKLIGRKNYILVLTPHGGFTPEWSTFPFLQRFAKQLYHNTLGVWLINQSIDGVRAVSEWEKNEMIACGMKPEIVTVISNGIENMAFENVDSQVKAEFKKKISGYGKYLLQIGRIHTIKNFETTIKALAELPPEVKFVIAGPVGEPDYKAGLEQLTRKLGLQDRVIFFGTVFGAEKYYLIKNAEMMVHMAIWESYCNVVHEGMSQGLVCVVADNTALPLLIKDGVNGYCLPAKDVQKLAQKLLFVLNNKNSPEIKEIQKTNRESVKAHSWSNVAKKMEEWYSGFIQKMAK